MEKLIIGDIWKEVNALVIDYKKQKTAVIAYVTTTKLLLAENDILICDASENQINSGQTSVKTLQAYLSKGVEIYSIENLHAKFLFSEDFVVAGSANLSINSAENLIETALYSNSTEAIQSLNSFKQSLLVISQKVDAAYLSVFPEQEPKTYNLTSTNNLNRIKLQEVISEGNERITGKVTQSEIRFTKHNQKYVFLKFWVGPLHRLTKETKHLYAETDVEQWEKAIQKGQMLDVFGIYVNVKSLPSHYAINVYDKTPKTELKVFVLCDINGALKESPERVAMDMIEKSGYYKLY